MAVLTTARKGSVLTYTVVGFPTLSVDVEKLTEAVKFDGLCNGITQTLVDAAALPRDPATGKPATPAEKYAALKARYDTIMAGYWTSGGAIYQALAAVLGVDYATARAKFDAMSEAEQKAVRGTKRVQDALAALRPAGSNEVGDALLDAAMAEE